MMKENYIKSLIMVGGGVLLFYLIKPKKNVCDNVINSRLPQPTEIKSLDASTSNVNLKDADIVANAYAEALKAGENTTNLTELNKELTKEFGMRCFVSDVGKINVCDVSGNIILKK